MTAHSVSLSSVLDDTGTYSGLLCSGCQHNFVTLNVCICSPRFYLTSATWILITDHLLWVSSMGSEVKSIGDQLNIAQSTVRLLRKACSSIMLACKVRYPVWYVIIEVMSSFWKILFESADSRLFESTSLQTNCCCYWLPCIFSLVLKKDDCRK